MRLRLVAVLASAAGLLAFAGAAPAITGGQPDNGAHPYVGAILVPGVGLCTGAALDSDTVLTAAHCVKDGRPAFVSFAAAPLPNGFPPPDPADIAAFFVTGTATAMPGACMPCGNGLPQFAHNDIALIQLDRPVSLPRYATLPTVGLSAGLEKKQLTIVGYGAQLVKSGVPQSNFERTTASVRVSPSEAKIGDEFLKVSANKGGSCFGDSGGPILFGDTVVAINSFVTNGNCAGVGYGTRIDTSAALAFVG